MTRKFRFKTKPYSHQIKEFRENRHKRARALLWQMRSGKSKAMVDLSAYLRWKKEITGVVILAPNGVHDNWLRREFPAHCSLPFVGAVYRSYERQTVVHEQRLRKVCQPGRNVKVLAINSETVWRDHPKKTLARFLKGHKGKVLLIVDESHDYRTPGSKRTKTVRAFSKKCPWRRILTGTAVSNTPLAAFSQFEILKPGALGFKTYARFKERYATYEMARTKGGRKFEKLVGYRNQEELRDRMSAWSSVVLRSDMGVPPLQHVRRAIPMTAKQQDLFERLKKEYLLEEAAYDGGARLIKLQQIQRGWYMNDDGEIVDIMADKDNPALQALMEEVTNVEGKIIIWANFREDIKRINRVFQKYGIQHVIYQGGMKPQDRVASINAFMGHEDCKGFLGQPVAGGTGLNLSAANTILWYSHVFDLITREQASERATDMVKDWVDVVDFETIGGVDGFMLDSHAAKRNVSDELAGRGLKAVLLGEEEFY